jgi:hypothetical protein
MSETVPEASSAGQQPIDGQNPLDSVLNMLQELATQAKEWQEHGLPPELAAAVQSAEATQHVEQPQTFDARPVGQVGLARHTDIQLDPPQSELRVLPSKPLCECDVEDLEGLNRHQLAELIFASTRYNERTVRHVAFRNGLSGALAYSLVLDKPDETIVSTSIEAENVRIHEPEQQQSHLRFVDIHLPHIPDGSAKTLRSGLRAIDEKLRGQNLPAISWLEERDEKNVELFWRNSPEEILAQHNYGDGPLFMEHEQPHDMLAGEIRDLQELGFDFDDIARALETVTRTMRQAIVTNRMPEVPNTGPWRVTNVTDGLPSQYTIKNLIDPTQQGLTKQWKHNTSSMPFKNVQVSRLDHELGKTGHPGWRIPISETSLELYKHRIIEGHYQPHYRISAARTVWAMEMGTPEQQARALQIDWNHTSEALNHAAANEDRAGMNAIFNYMMRYFPRDDAPWRQGGFPGYSYQGITYSSLRELLNATVAQYDHIKLVIPQNYSVYRRISLHGIDDDV